MSMITLISVVAVMLICVILYNSLIGKKNQVENIFGTVDALLKKRYDLIPNLVSSVRAYMQHERGTLNELTELRAKAISGTLTDNEKVELNNKLSRALGGIMVAVENYPDLKASQNFIQLQAAMNEIEEQISAARRAYNASVTDYNNAVEMFPTNLAAGLMRYDRKKVFEIPQAERTSPDAKELFEK